MNDDASDTSSDDSEWLAFTPWLAYNSRLLQIAGILWGQ